MGKDKKMNNYSFGLLKVNINGEVLYANDISKILLDKSETEINKKQIQSIIPPSNIIAVIKNNKDELSISKFKNMLLIECPNKDGRTGNILIFTKFNYQAFLDYFGEAQDLNQDMEELMNLSGELVTITDANGYILRVSAQSESMMGFKEHEFVGRSVYDLEKSGVLSTSSTIQVIKTKRMCELPQVTQTGKRLFVRGYPIFSEDGQLEKVINLSRDITEEYNLKRSLDETKELVDYYHKELVKKHSKENELIMKSKAMQEIYDLSYRIAEVDVTVLLLGESGVGKDVVARTIHKLSNRNNKPFVKINCGAIPENLIESELFGYSKGTFTGANKEGKQGLFMAANSGTLFLDEIGELPINLQVKLLQVLQESQITPLGQTEPIDIDVRMITATNRNLSAMVAEGSFRKDLYYRLNVVPITIPPLRERKEDIPFLIDHFLKKYNKKYNEIKFINEEVISLLIENTWEGNVRELENMIERLIVTVPNKEILVKHLPKDKVNRTTDEPLEGATLKDLIEDYEKRILLKAAESSRSYKELGQKLGVDTSTVSRKFRKHKIYIAETQYSLQK